MDFLHIFNNDNKSDFTLIYTASILPLKIPLPLITIWFIECLFIRLKCAFDEHVGSADGGAYVHNCPKLWVQGNSMNSGCSAQGTPYFMYSSNTLSKY